MFTRNEYAEGDEHMVYEMLADIHHSEYPQLYRHDAISVYHIARAALRCHVRLGCLSWWLNMHS